MANLKNYREQIDAIDEELVHLIDRRMAVSREIGEAKAESGSQVYHAGRHETVIAEALRRSDGSCPPDDLRRLFRELLSVSLNLQRSLTVAYLGPVATFSHFAALERFGSAVKYTPMETIPTVFEAVEKGTVDYGVVPVENSTGGMVHVALDAFTAHESIKICAEYYVPVRHCLLSNVPVEKIRVVYSHPQPFAQCGKWLDENLNHAARQEVASTVTGVLEAIRTPAAAAIGSALAAQHYGLPAVVESIEDDRANTTRFLIISKEDATPYVDSKTSISFAIRNEPGALFTALQAFARRGINMTKIESRPNRRQAWEPLFFVDVVGHRSEENLAAALAEVELATDSFRVLGSYPRQVSAASLEAVRKLTG